MTAWLAIANPSAGRLRDKEFQQRWIPLIKRHVDQVVYTERPGHATVLASAASSYDGIAVIGGDGTINEVLNGIDRSRQRLAVLPAGRGNSLARDLGVRGIAAGLSSLAGSSCVPIDLMAYELTRKNGVDHQGLAAVTLSLGVVAATVRAAQNFRAFGQYGYLMAGILTRPRSFQVDLCKDGTPCAGYLLTGVIANNTQWLGNFHAFPDASMTDGYFDVAMLNFQWLRQTLYNLSLATHTYTYEPVSKSPAKSIQIELAEPNDAIVDGELVDGVTALRIKCRPNALLCQRPRT